MKRSRFLRAVIGVGTAWGVAWASAMAILAVVSWLTFLRRFATLSHLSLPTFVIQQTLYGFCLGATAGVVFAFVLAALESRRTLEALAAWRVALWGGFASVVLLVIASAVRSSSDASASTLEIAVGTVLVAGLGASSAVATLRAARRGRLSEAAQMAQLSAT